MSNRPLRDKHRRPRRRSRRIEVRRFDTSRPSGGDFVPGMFSIRAAIIGRFDGRVVGRVVCEDGTCLRLHI